MHKGFLKTGILLALISVIAGAFGAHALKQKFGEPAMAIYETGVRYEFYHAFALMILGVLFKSFTNKKMIWAGKCFIGGVVIFCGSLFILTILKANGINNYNWIGAITPVGGLLFIAGWFLMFTGIENEVVKN